MLTFAGAGPSAARRARPVRLRSGAAVGVIARRAQRGATLVIVLILLLVMTLLTLASLRGAILETRMSANLADRSQAFQAAEAALRKAEARVRTDAPAGSLSFPAAGSCSQSRLCGMPQATDTGQVWEKEDNWKAALPLTQTPVTDTRYLLEQVGPCLLPGPTTTSGDVSVKPPSANCYRITARSQSAGGARVLLQSIVAVR